jgi:hypothetical protein
MPVVKCSEWRETAAESSFCQTLQLLNGETVKVPTDLALAEHQAGTPEFCSG